MWFDTQDNVATSTGEGKGNPLCATKITNASSIALSIVALCSITFHTKKNIATNAYNMSQVPERPQGINHHPDRKKKFKSKNVSVGMSVQTLQFTSRLSTTPPYSSKHKVAFDYKSPHWLAFIYHPKEIDAANYTSLAGMGAPPSNAITMGVHRESPSNARTCLEELV